MFSRSSSKPPQFENHHHVGYIRSAHGIRGELFLRLSAGTADWRAGAKRVFLLAPGDGQLTEYAVVGLRPHKDGLLAVLKSVASREAAEALRGAQVYVSDNLLESSPGETIFLKEVLGFKLVDREGAALGEITAFATNGAQDLLVVRRVDGGRALVPFVDAFLVDIDFDKRVVRVDLPEGLLNLDDR